MPYILFLRHCGLRVVGTIHQGSQSQSTNSSNKYQILPTALLIRFYRSASESALYTKHVAPTKMWHSDNSIQVRIQNNQTFMIASWKSLHYVMGKKNFYWWFFLLLYNIKLIKLHHQRPGRVTHASVNKTIIWSGNGLLHENVFEIKSFYPIKCTRKGFL